mgnify:CR=1 FL=1
MQIYTNNNSSFPNQVVPDSEKATMEYGVAVGRVIEELLQYQVMLLITKSIII